MTCTHTSKKKNRKKNTHKHTHIHTHWGRLLYHLLPRLSQLVSAEEVLQACQCVFAWCVWFWWMCGVCDVSLRTEQNRHIVQLSVTLMKSSQATLIPPEGHCQNNKQLGFFKGRYLSWTGERYVHMYVWVHVFALWVCLRHVPLYWQVSSPHSVFGIELLIGWSNCLLLQCVVSLHTSSLLLGADPFGRRQPPLLILFSSGGHLDAYLHRNGPSTQLQWPPPRRDGNASDPATLPRLGEQPWSAPRPPAETPLVLDKNQDITQREVGLALAAGQQIMLPRYSPPRAEGGGLWRWRSRPWIMIGLCCRKGRGRQNMSSCAFFF